MRLTSELNLPMAHQNTALSCLRQVCHLEITQVSGMHFRTRKSSLNALDALGVALRIRFGSLLEERLAISE